MSAKDSKDGEAKTMNRFMETLLMLVLSAAAALAQTQITGQISGTVNDASGAVLPQTKITANNKDTGLIRTTETNATGYYLIPLLQPGNYMISATVTGFQTVVRDGITVAVGHAVLVDFRLKPGTINEKVTVTAQAPLIEPGNPNTTTTFNRSAISELPNAGNDLTYYANLAPGAVLSVGGANSIRGGNVEVNGLPALANDFTIDGLDANDTFINSNSTGASGLQLGVNAVQEVTVNTTAYSVEQGRSSAAQVNFRTRSGGNQFHGNASEMWNGSALNARNYFLNLLGVHKKPRTNVNQFAAALGGPVWKNKVFFFADLEGVRLVIPALLTSNLPSPEYQSYVLQQLPLGGNDPLFGPLPPQPGEMGLYRSMFGLMGDTSRGSAIPILDCPFDADGVTPTKIPGSGDGCLRRRSFSAAPITTETLVTGKLDYAPNERNSFWFRFQTNDGQKASPDADSAVFDLVTRIPIRSAAAGWTHVFSPSLVNQFNPGISYRDADINIADPAKALATVPIAFGGPDFDFLGLNLSFNTARFATTTWQLNDNLVWTKGRHFLRFGGNLRRVLSNNTDGILAVPLAAACTLAEYTYGATCFLQQAFHGGQGHTRVRFVNLDSYAMDTLHLSPKLTLTLGIRATWNSKPISTDRVLSRLNGTFATISHDVNRPPNLDILTDQASSFARTQILQWGPRGAIAYEVRENTLLQAGFGVFSQSYNYSPQFFAAEQVPSTFVANTGLFFPNTGIAIVSGVPNSAVDAAAAANQQLRTNFRSGGLSCASPLAPPDACVPPINFSTVSGDGTGRVPVPYSMQWSLSLSQQLRQTLAIVLKYTGTAGRQMAYTDSPNLFQTSCLGCFNGLAFNVAPDARFGSVSDTHSGANSSYHAAQLSVEKRVSHGLLFQANYTYSHCVDFVSNGGIAQYNLLSTSDLLPGSLARNRGNCDYDIRHSLNGSYVYELPFHSSRALVEKLIGGWQVAGTMFVRGGLPFSVISPTANQFSGFPTIFANSVPGQNPYTRPVPDSQTGTIQWLSPTAFQSVIDPTTGDCVGGSDPQHCTVGNTGRNRLRAPGYTWFDLSVTKRIRLSERVSFKLDTQLFNIFNHPNFDFPNRVAGVPSNPATLPGFGAISGTVSPATGLLGVGLGGDSSGRMIAIRGRVEF